MHDVPTVALRDEFLEDHRSFTRLLRQLLDAVERRDLPAACELAERIDRQVGSHIEFEEQVLYPRVAKTRGWKFARQLLQEHKLALATIVQLQAAGGGEPHGETFPPAVLEGLREAMRHAESCGTLISQLTTLSAQEQADALAQLVAFRRQGRRWSELKGRPRQRPEPAGEPPPEQD